MNLDVKLRAFSPPFLIAIVLACSGGKSANDQQEADDSVDGDTGDGDTESGDGDTGDGDTGDGDAMGGAPGGDGDTQDVVSTPTSSDCDLSGTWAVVAKTVTLALGGNQVANRWYLYEISHRGDDVEVVRSLNCKVRVENAGGISTTVTISDAALAGILQHNSHAGLKGTFTKSGETCVLDLERQYTVLGVSPSDYLPEDPSTRPELASLPPLPTEDDPSGADDWDGDGTKGLLFNVDSFLSGSRNSVQRGFLEFDSDETNPDYTISLNSSEFTVNNTTAIEEVVIAASSELFKTLGTLEGTDHPVTFTHLGDTRKSAKFPSGANIPDSDLEACLALEKEFPYSQ